MYQYKHMISPIFYTIWQNVSPQFPKTDVHIFYVKSDSTDVSLLFSTVNCRDVGDLDCQRQQQKLVISQWIPEMSGLLMLATDTTLPSAILSYRVSCQTLWELKLYLWYIDWLPWSLITVGMLTFSIDHHINTCRLSGINFSNGVSSTFLYLSSPKFKG